MAYFPRFYIRGLRKHRFHLLRLAGRCPWCTTTSSGEPALKGFPIFDQADVEVLRGPQGTLFGRNSPAGVVKLESGEAGAGRAQRLRRGLRRHFQHREFRRRRERARHRPDRIRASTQGQHRDNWVNDPINDSRLEGYDDWALRLQMLYKPDDTFTALLNVHGRTLRRLGTAVPREHHLAGSNTIVPGFNPANIDIDGRNGQNFSSVGSNLH